MTFLSLKNDIIYWESEYRSNFLNFAYFWKRLDLLCRSHLWNRDPLIGWYPCFWQVFFAPITAAQRLCKLLCRFFFFFLGDLWSNCGWLINYVTFAWEWNEWVMFWLLVKTKLCKLCMMHSSDSLGRFPMEIISLQ